MATMKDVNRIIVACAVIHNIVLDREGRVENEILDRVRPAATPQAVAAAALPAGAPAATRAAERWRNGLAQAMFDE